MLLQDSALGPAEELWRRKDKWVLRPTRTLRDQRRKNRGWVLEAFSVDGRQWVVLDHENVNALRLVIAALRAEKRV